MEKLCSRPPRGPACETLPHGARALGHLAPAGPVQGDVCPSMLVHGGGEPGEEALGPAPGGPGKGKPCPSSTNARCWVWLRKVSRGRLGESGEEGSPQGTAEGSSDLLVPAGQA